MGERSNIERAVEALTGVMTSAFADAVSLEVKASAVAAAFADLDYEQRIELGEQHPSLAEQLLAVELHFDRRVR